MSRYLLSVVKFSCVGWEGLMTGHRGRTSLSLTVSFLLL